MIKLSKRQYYNEYFDLHKNNSKKTWSGIKWTISLKHNPSFVPSKLIIDNFEITEVTRIANKFNTYFADIGNNLANEIPSAHVSPSSYLPPFPQTVCFFLFPTCSSEIEEEISNLNVNKASGPFSIPTKILKLLLRKKKRTYIKTS